MYILLSTSPLMVVLEIKMRWSCISLHTNHRVLFKSSATYPSPTIYSPVTHYKFQTCVRYLIEYALNNKPILPEMIEGHLLKVEVLSISRITHPVALAVRSWHACAPLLDW